MEILLRMQNLDLDLLLVVTKLTRFGREYYPNDLPKVLLSASQSRGW